MANTAITPTRMVLNQLKGRLKTARRGHKLLKDKRDELMRQFLDNVRLNKQLRAKVEQGLTEAFGSLSVASAIMSPEMLEQSLLYPRQSVELGMTYQNIMSVNVPVYDFQTRNSDPSEIFPYGFAQTSGELDDALEKLAEVFWAYEYYFYHAYGLVSLLAINKKQNKEEIMVGLTPLTHA